MRMRRRKEGEEKGGGKVGSDMGKNGVENKEEK